MVSESEIQTGKITAGYCWASAGVDDDQLAIAIVQCVQ